MKILDYLTASPARFFLLAALVWGGLMCYLNFRDGANFSWHDLLVEANGMVFDLFVFGILLSVYEALKEKKEKIARLHEEIDDYRGWDEKEAMYRIVGAVRRLNKLKVSKMVLAMCYLKGAQLSNANLRESNLQTANLREAFLQLADFSHAHLSHADFRQAELNGANFQGADLSWTKLQGANFHSGITKFEHHEDGTVLIHTQNTNLQGVNFKGALVDKDWFDKLEVWGVIGKEEIIAKYLID
ncbi:MAG: pentapeptide repeat-containing protein [Saprospiraceae bacterium]